MFNQFREVIEVIHHLLIRILPVQNSGIPRFFPAYPILNHSHVDTTDNCKCYDIRAQQIQHHIDDLDQIPWQCYDSFFLMKQGGEQ